MYSVDFESGWDIFYQTFSSDIRSRIAKKIRKLVFLEKVRHLKHGLPYFVVEVEQYRICFTQVEYVRKIIFVGNHKQYEKWYLEQQP